MTTKELMTLTKRMECQIDKFRHEMEDAIFQNSHHWWTTYAQRRGCHDLFLKLRDALDDFSDDLKRTVNDLPLQALVMCKAHETCEEGWELQYYVEKGTTKPDILSEQRRDDWLYIVPIEDFQPSSPLWKPEDKKNWANFGKEEDKA